jgi:hypothetical protein
MQTAASPYGVCREHVEALIRDGEPLAGIEELLAEWRLDSEERDALWLVAWSLEQRLDERDRLVLEGSPPWTARPHLFALPGGQG